MHTKNNIPMINIKNLPFPFGFTIPCLNNIIFVISDLTVNVKAGEIMAIAGSSGSGKSLLAHAIMGILPQIPSAEVKWNIWASL